MNYCHQWHGLQSFAAGSSDAGYWVMLWMHVGRGLWWDAKRIGSLSLQVCGQVCGHVTHN